MRNLWYAILQKKGTQEYLPQWVGYNLNREAEWRNIDEGFFDQQESIFLLLA
jgi:hypothetical protein